MGINSYKAIITLMINDYIVDYYCNDIYLMIKKLIRSTFSKCSYTVVFIHV